MCVAAVIVSNIDRLIFTDNNEESDVSPFDPNKSFGHEMLEYFELDKEWSHSYFNWGSHGGIPIYVMEAAQKLYERIANCPQCFFSIDRENEIYETLQLLAEYLGIEDWDDLVFVENASQ